MSNFPFIYAPDVFCLVISNKHNVISLKFFESQWGLTDELLCFYQDVLIGMITPERLNPQLLGENTISIQLLPKLDRNRNYDWSSCQQFARKLNHLLTHTSPWIMRCEYDCDQYHIQVIEEDISTSITALEQALNYSVGENVNCPSFLSSRK